MPAIGSSSRARWAGIRETIEAKNLGNWRKFEGVGSLSRIAQTNVESSSGEKKKKEIV
jgi:hypothetical protein